MSEANGQSAFDSHGAIRASKPFDMNRVQFTDDDSLRRINECVLIVMREYARLAQQPTDSALEQALMQGYPQPDGSLLVRSVSPDGRNQDTVVPAAGWRQLADEEYRELDQRLTLHRAQHPSQSETSISRMAALIRKPGDHFAIAAAAIGQMPTHAVAHADLEPEQVHGPAVFTAQSYAIVLDRSEVAAALLRQIDGHADLRAHIHTDAFRFWQQSEQPYVVVWGIAGQPGELTLASSNLTAVLSEALPGVMQRLAAEGVSCTFLIGVDLTTSQPIEERLAQLQAASEKK